mmetsp:Transcript_24758/g.51807  ORF Transcript_24758/g.51807 Transcript_24758/m.51807 type:complete len:161 (+) Transcript_24758:33-515(+)
MGKNNNKPQRPPPKPEASGEDYEEKPFHSKQFEKEYLDSLLNAPERQTWDEFKEQQRKKGEMESADARAEEEAQREFRRQLDAERAAKLTRKADAKAEAADGSRKKEKHKKEKHKKKKRKHADSESSDSAQEKRPKKEKRTKAEAPVSLSSFFNNSDSDS